MKAVLDDEKANGGVPLPVPALTIPCYIDRGR